MQLQYGSKQREDLKMATNEMKAVTIIAIMFILATMILGVGIILLDQENKLLKEIDNTVIDAYNLCVGLVEECGCAAPGEIQKLSKLP